MIYSSNIGLEIHLELKTRTKMFCGCLNNPNETNPNINICPICLAHPGALPKANKEAIEAVIKLGLALEGKIADYSFFERKSYFYPDLPKGYQISQYAMPLVQKGRLKNIGIRRIHIEEDTGKIIHQKNSSLIDFNRAGVPLAELVTEPEIKSGEEASAFAKELKAVIRALDVSSADMEKGQMRIEANVSLKKSGDADLGIKVEIKNLNSFKAVSEAVDYEIRRQAGILDSGGKILQETRGWNENSKKTFPQRTKEQAHDYRYFPEPDLPPFDLTEPDFINIEKLRLEIPELPAKKITRLKNEYGLAEPEAKLLMETEADWFFEESVSELKALTAEPNVKIVFNYLTSDVFGLIKDLGIGFEDLRIKPADFAALLSLFVKGTISSRIAKDLLAEMQKTGDGPEAIIKEKSIIQISDEKTVKLAAEKAISENPGAVEDYKKGKSSALQFLIGKTMAELKGQGNPSVIQETIKQLLK